MTTEINAFIIKHAAAKVGDTVTLADGSEHVFSIGDFEAYSHARLVLRKHLIAMLNQMPNTQASGLELFLRPVYVLARIMPTLTLKQAAEFIDEIGQSINEERLHLPHRTLSRLPPGWDEQS
ncbi:MAG: hypothetical protein WA742_12510 [Candidatus Cybelea sp.]